MDMETALSILSLSVSIGGLIPVFLLRNKLKEVSLALVVISLIVISSIVTYSNYQHSNIINNLSQDIISHVDKKLLTFDQLYENLHYVKQSDINLALEQLVASGKLKHKVIELTDVYGDKYRVRGYFIE